MTGTLFQNMHDLATCCDVLKDLLEEFGPVVVVGDVPHHVKAAHVDGA